MTIHEELKSLVWPEEFMAFYLDGTSERLLKGDGVLIMPSADAPDGVGGISAAIPQKHPQNQKNHDRYISFAELSELRTTDDVVLWKRTKRR